MTDWIQTASGIAFWPLRPRIEDVRIEDIAHALAAVNRFNGHTRVPWSVAEHSLQLTYELVRVGSPRETCLYGLLHDASEAYLCDMPRPLKRAAVMAGYRLAEAELQ